jgi:hypothetical protein
MTFALVGSVTAQADHKKAKRTPAEQANVFEFTTGNCSEALKCTLIIEEDRHIRLFKGGVETAGRFFEGGGSFHCHEKNLDGDLFYHDDKIVGIQWSDGKIWGDITNAYPGPDRRQYLGSWEFYFTPNHDDKQLQHRTIRMKDDGQCDDGDRKCVWEFTDGHFRVTWSDGGSYLTSENWHDMHGSYYTLAGQDSGGWRAERSH